MAPTFEELSRRYAELVDDAILCEADTARDALALVEFAAVITAERSIFEIYSYGGPVCEETDRHHAVMALSAAVRWINARDIEDLLRENRTKRAAVTAAGGAA